jgi:hypothetical protein
MDNVIDLIEKAEREIKRDAEDLTRLKVRYPGYDFVRVEPAKRQLSALETAILSLINFETEKEWTSRSVTTALRERPVSLPENDDAAMNAVGGALIVLVCEKKIRRSHQGRGRDPHRYIAIGKGEQETTPA